MASRRCSGLAVAAALVACGGKPPVEPGPKVSAVPLTRVAVEDAEPDDGVQVISGKGHVEPRVVEAAIAPHRDAMTACYLSRVGKRRWLGGQLVLRWGVAADGAFDQVAITDNDLGAWPIEQCLLELARGLTFGPPIGGAAEVTLPLAFTPSGTRGAPARWDEAQSDRAVGVQLAKLDACGKKATAPDDVTITLYAGPRGKVESVGFASAMAIDDAWAICAEKAALAWHLPDPKGQVTKLAVRYGRVWTSHRPKSSS